MKRWEKQYRKAKRRIEKKNDGEKSVIGLEDKRRLSSKSEMTRSSVWRWKIFGLCTRTSFKDLAIRKLRRKVTITSKKPRDNLENPRPRLTLLSLSLTLNLAKVKVQRRTKSQFGKTSVLLHYAGSFTFFDSIQPSTRSIFFSKCLCRLSRSRRPWKDYASFYDRIKYRKSETARKIGTRQERYSGFLYTCI